MRIFPSNFSDLIIFYSFVGHKIVIQKRKVCKFAFSEWNISNKRYMSSIKTLYAIHIYVYTG